MSHPNRTPYSRRRGSLHRTRRSRNCLDRKIDNNINKWETTKTSSWCCIQNNFFPTNLWIPSSICTIWGELSLVSIFISFLKSRTAFWSFKLCIFITWKTRRSRSYTFTQTPDDPSPKWSKMNQTTKPLQEGKYTSPMCFWNCLERTNLSLCAFVTLGRVSSLK